MIKNCELLSGWTSRVPFKKGHIFMADLDGINLRKVIKVVKELQEKYYKTIGNVVITKSSKGHYHILSFYLNTFKDNIRVLIELVSMGVLDINYLKFCFLRKSRVLRISPKISKGSPVFIKYIINPLCKRKELIDQRDLYLSTLEYNKNKKTVRMLEINEDDD